MGKRDQIKLERADGEGTVEGDFVQLDLVFEIGFAEFTFENLHGERCCVDRATQPVPQVLYGTQMIFMGVGQHQPGKPVFSGFDE
jgi:hypothetical protein